MARSKAGVARFPTVIERWDRRVASRCRPHIYVSHPLPTTIPTLVSRSPTIHTSYSAACAPSTFYQITSQGYTAHRDHAGIRLGSA